jgi:DNA-binding response OmpR family regulator
VRASVLLVESDPAIRITFKAVLEQEGYEVKATSSLAGAKRYLTSKDAPEAVITEANLEHDCDGPETGP